MTNFERTSLNWLLRELGMSFRLKRHSAGRPRALTPEVMDEIRTRARQISQGRKAFYHREARRLNVSAMTIQRAALG